MSEQPGGPWLSGRLTVDQDQDMLVLDLLPQPSDGPLQIVDSGSLHFAVTKAHQIAQIWFTRATETLPPNATRDHDRGINGAVNEDGSVDLAVLQGGLASVTRGREPTLPIPGHPLRVLALMNSGGRYVGVRIFDAKVALFRS